MYKGLDMSNKKCKHFSLSNVSESPDIYVEYLGTLAFIIHVSNTCY